MLQKFKAIEEIGRFSKLTHKAEPLTKLSLVFGRNGYGKSTLCSILRSAADGKADHITARRRLGAVNDSRVETLWASGSTFAYSAGGWNGCPGRIYIFDNEYVAKNLHVGDSVTRENKRSLLPVVLGDQGVSLAEKVVALDKEQREVDEKRKNHSRAISLRCRSILDKEVAAFCNAVVPDDLDEKIRNAAQRVERAQQAAVIKQKVNPSPAPIGDLAKITHVLAVTIDGVSENAAQLVSQHLEVTSLGERAHAWLEYGTHHAPGDQCPYCAQGTNGVPLVAAYRAYFSEAFKALKARIDECQRILSEVSTGRLTEIIRRNDADFSYWAKLCDLPCIPVLTGEEQAAVNAAQESLRALVGIKLGNPLEPVAAADGGASIQAALGRLAVYNEGVAAASAAIDKARSEVDDFNLQQAESNHQKWLAMAEKAKDPVKAAVEGYLVADARFEAIKVEKTSAQTALTNYTSTTMAARQATVNDLLVDFGANFRVVDAKTNFIGREPNTEFAIEIGTHKIKAGDKSDSAPSFKTVLSAGDKTTLALAFFIAQIGGDPNLHDTVVVFDDPFSSQDMDRQFQTTSHIRSICEKVCQTIVLSHDPRFLQMIEKNADNNVVRTFQLQCSDSGEGALERWSSAEELKSLYTKQSELIREYASHQKLLKGQTLNSVHQSIRPFMEDYLRLRFPGRFPDQSHIHDMANAIRDAGATAPMADHVADLYALNEYTRPNMHGGGNAPVPGELRAHCRKVVAIVGSY